MMTFRSVLPSFQLPMSAAWLMNDVAEAKGKQELFTKQSPQILKALRENAIVQSVESSNRIEGVTVEPDRLRPLVLGGTRPKDRSEEEIHGYRNALQRIHERIGSLPTTPETLRWLHKTIQEGAGDAGEWKAVANDIVEIRPGSAPRVRFRTMAVEQTPEAVSEMCLQYRQALDQLHAPPLVATAALVFDFLCIHPFRDGNGRISRLLTVRELYRHGYEVGRYISIERLIEETKEDYYHVLEASSAGWHEGKHDFLPWLNYFLSIVRRAYILFEERAGEVKSPRGAKTSMVEAMIATFPGEFRIADIETASPGVSRDLIRKVLQKLRREGKIESISKGSNALWRNRVVPRERGKE